MGEGGVGGQGLDEQVDTVLVHTLRFGIRLSGMVDIVGRESPVVQGQTAGGGGSCRQNLEDVLAVERRKNLDSLLKSGVITEVEYQNEIEKGMK